MDPQEFKRAQHELVVSAGAEMRPIADAAWNLERARLEGRRFVTIDLEALMSPAARNSMGETLEWWTSNLVVSSYTERFRLMAWAVVALAAQKALWNGPEIRAHSISTETSGEAYYRRCTRVLAMVHELHKAGYQRIRILPMISPSGGHWRGIITYAGNVADDGYHILDWDMDDRVGSVARYSSSQENEFFGWKDAHSLNARQLAQRFVERFPVIASKGEGTDWAYAGWLTDVLGQAEAGPERGGLIHLIQDWDNEPDYMARWQPPPPIRDIVY